MNSDYRELMGVSRLLQQAEERIEELEADLENANDYTKELKGEILDLKQALEFCADEYSELQADYYELEERDAADLRQDRVLEGLITDLEFGFVMNPDDPITHQEFLTRALVEYLRSKGVVRHD